MKRKVLAGLIEIIFVLLFSLICLADGTAYEENDNRFYENHYDEAVSVEESRYLTIGYRVSKSNDGISQPDSNSFFQIQYDLILINKSEQAMNNLYFIMHLPETVQQFFVTPNWYNEPISLAPQSPADHSDVMFYSWTPLIQVNQSADSEIIKMSDFYNMLIEIIWDGGSELIRLDMESVNVPLEVMNGLQDAEPLEEKDFDMMIGK